MQAKGFVFRVLFYAVVIGVEHFIEGWQAGLGLGGYGADADPWKGLKVALQKVCQHSFLTGRGGFSERVAERGYAIHAEPLAVLCRGPDVV